MGSPKLALSPSKSHSGAHSHARVRQGVLELGSGSASSAYWEETAYARMTLSV